MAGWRWRHNHTSTSVGTVICRAASLLECFKERKRLHTRAVRSKRHKGKDAREFYRLAPFHINKRDSWRHPCGQIGQDQDSAAALSSDRPQRSSCSSQPTFPFPLLLLLQPSPQHFPAMRTLGNCFSATSKLLLYFFIASLAGTKLFLNSILHRSFPSSSFGCCSYFGNNNHNNNNNNNTTNTNIQSTESSFGITLCCFHNTSKLLRQLPIASWVGAKLLPHLNSVLQCPGSRFGRNNDNKHHSTI